MTDELKKRRDELWEKYKELNPPKGNAKFYYTDNTQYWCDGFDAGVAEMQAQTKPLIGKCLKCDADFELCNSAAMDIIRERDSLKAQLDELKSSYKKLNNTYELKMLELSLYKDGEEKLKAALELAVKALQLLTTAHKNIFYGIDLGSEFPYKAFKIGEEALARIKELVK